MRVLLVNTSERIGGAAIAASRLLRALNRCGVEAEMLVRDKQTDNPRVITIADSPVQRLRFAADRAYIYLRNGLTRQNLFAIDTGRFGTDITRRPEFRRADVVHLHWINQGLLSLRDVERICQSGKRVVWTMHDMWPFTGICHHADQCLLWKEACGNCPLLRRPTAHDLSWQVFRRKAQVYGAHRLSFVGCSNWLTGLAQQAPLLAGQHVESIPNPIDTVRYTPVGSAAERDKIRRSLGLPTDRQLLLFVAYKVTTPAKGIAYLREAIAQLCTQHPEWRSQLGLVAVGREAERLRGSFEVPVYAAEYTETETVMTAYYRAADLLVMPTLMDNLPNTIMEAMACGVPCVGFEVGGLPQMITHETDGYLVRYKDTAHLVYCLHEALTSPHRAELSRAARHKAVTAYSEEAVAARYAALYERQEKTLQ